MAAARSGALALGLEIEGAYSYFGCSFITAPRYVSTQ